MIGRKSTKTKTKEKRGSKKTPQNAQKGMGKRAQKPKEKPRIIVAERPTKKREAGPPLKITPCTKKKVTASRLSPETVIKNIKGGNKK